MPEKNGWTGQTCSRILPAQGIRMNLKVIWKLPLRLLDSDHGTHVSGIIAADRDNGIGIDGVASGACSIMTVRVVPDGDELDKDVANGMYAADNVGEAINMSFGKVVSPEVERVRAASLRRGQRCFACACRRQRRF